MKTPGVPRPVRLPSPDPEYARAFTNALNTARRRYNRGRPENEQISVTARPADPRTGRCVNCDRPDSACRQTPPGLICLHAKTVSRDEGLAYVLGHYGATPEEWEANGGYNPHKPRPRRHGQDAGQESAPGKVPATCPHCHRRWRVPAGWQRFTCPACHGLVEHHAPPAPANRPGLRQRASAARNEPGQPPARLRGGGAPRPAARTQQQAPAGDGHGRAEAGGPARQAPPLGRLAVVPDVDHDRGRSRAIST